MWKLVAFDQHKSEFGYQILSVSVLGQYDKLPWPGYFTEWGIPWSRTEKIQSGSNFFFSETWSKNYLIKTNIFCFIICFNFCLQNTSYFSKIILNLYFLLLEKLYTTCKLRVKIIKHYQKWLKQYWYLIITGNPD